MSTLSRLLPTSPRPSEASVSSPRPSSPIPVPLPNAAAVTAAMTRVSAPAPLLHFPASSSSAAAFSAPQVPHLKPPPSSSTSTSTSTSTSSSLSASNGFSAALFLGSSLLDTPCHSRPPSPTPKIRSASGTPLGSPKRPPLPPGASPERAERAKTLSGSTNAALLSKENRSMSERKLFTPSADKLILVMVGLPARGKSFIAKKLARFMSWKGTKCSVFNVGALRRTQNHGTVQDHTFFDPTNAKAKEEREFLAKETVQHLLEWLRGDASTKGGDVGILDATNSTKARRQTLLEAFDDFAQKHHLSVHVVFVESICTNEAVLTANIAQKVTYSPDYQAMCVEDALADLKMRMQNYELAYEALDDDEGISYIKLFDLQSKVHAKSIYGHVAKSILPYMMSFHLAHRPIWLIRAGHCTEVRREAFEDFYKDPCVASRSARLSPLGLAFARRLAEFVELRREAYADRLVPPGVMDEGQSPTLVITSTLPRAVETAQFLPQENRALHATLNPLDKGECYGLTMNEMREQMPEMYEAFTKDPWKTRFPGGESYYDVMLRVEPVLIDMEQHTGPVAVISHISTLQVLYSYFLGVPIERCSNLAVPFHSVIELAPYQDGWTTTIFNLETDIVTEVPRSTPCS